MPRANKSSECCKYLVNNIQHQVPGNPHHASCTMHHAPGSKYHAPGMALYCIVMYRGFGGLNMLCDRLTSVPCARSHNKRPPAPTSCLGGKREALDKQGSHTPGHTTNTTAKSEQARRETNHSVAGRACCLGAPYSLPPECQKSCRSKHLARCTRHTTRLPPLATYLVCSYVAGYFSIKRVPGIILLVQFR